jgi:hypothetical protein
MDAEDILEPKVAVAVAATAAVLSPPVRNVLRRGAVYGLAGVLLAGDAASSFGRGVRRGAEQASHLTQEGEQQRAQGEDQVGADQRGNGSG